MIEAEWFTRRLCVRDAQLEDLPALLNVLVSNTATLLLDGVSEADPGELQRWLTDGDLPPGGHKDSYRLQTILHKESNEAIGYLSVYHGYPDPETLYIASLVIGQDWQGSGMGGELVDQLHHLNGLMDYPFRRLVVTSRNWRAVQFWVGHGFKTIAQVPGDLHLEEGHSARLELINGRSSDLAARVVQHNTAG